MKFRHYPLLIGLTLLTNMISGCGTKLYPKLYLSVDSINSGQFAPGRDRKVKYFLMPTDPTVDPDSLRFREMGSWLEKTMTSLGYERISDIQAADIVLCLYYWVGSGETKYESYTVPHFGRTGGGTYNYSGNSYSHNTGNRFTYSGQIQQSPQFGITGYSTGLRSYTEHERVIQLDAFVLSRTGETVTSKQVWQTKIESTGSSSDMRALFPRLLYASRWTIGRNTGGKKHVELYWDDPNVLEFFGIRE